jgi:hypothetical protein
VPVFDIELRKTRSLFVADICSVNHHPEHAARLTSLPKTIFDEILSLCVLFSSFTAHAPLRAAIK